MQYFENNELIALANYSGKEAKGAPPKDLEKLFNKLHNIAKIAIDGLPLYKEKQDKRDLKQSAGRNHGFKYKEYLWVKIYDDLYRNDERVFFNITIKKDGNLVLCIDFLRKKPQLMEQFDSNTRAKDIYQKSIVQLDLNVVSNNEETKIKDFIVEYITRHLQTLNDFRMIFNMQQYITLLSTNYNLILTGAPGTGKTFNAQQIANHFADADHVKLVQFHPSYDYTDFVEGLRPNNKNSFSRLDGVFKKFCKCAILGLNVDVSDKDVKDKEENLYTQSNNNTDEVPSGYDDVEKENGEHYVLIIDEINRGEISKIFGELFFCVESSHRGKNERIDTQYQNLLPDYDLFKKGFYVPKNVYIIGTMNDIDRSVESMDFAFRRRFAFKEILATDTQESILNSLDATHIQYKDQAIKKMNALNNAIYSENSGVGCNILEGFSAAYHIGAAYFKKIENYKGDTMWQDLWDYHIKGVLFEYLRGNPEAFALLTKLEKIYKDA